MTIARFSIALAALCASAACDDFHLREADAGRGGDSALLPLADACRPDAGALPGKPGAPGQPDAAAAPGPAPAGALLLQGAAIGRPSFRLECAYAFAAPCGSRGDGFAQAPATVELVLPGHQRDAVQNVMAPGKAHGQYALELAAGLAAAGLAPRATFRVAELEPPSCVFVLLQLVPDAARAPTGSSPDFPSGPILAPRSFPLRIDGGLRLGSELVAPALDFVYPGKAALAPEPPGEGYSHLPLVFFVNRELAAAQPGTYALELRIVDAQGQGWQASASYAIQ